MQSSGAVAPDLVIPFDRAVLEIAAAPPFEGPSATVVEAAGKIICQFVTDAVKASGLAEASHDDALSAQEVAVALACWGAIRLSAELDRVGPAPQPSDLMSPLLQSVSVRYSEAEVMKVVETGMAVFNAMRKDPKLDSLCDAIQDLFVLYARTGDPAHVELAATALRGLAEARRRPVSL